jgi:hypothetical protein
VSLRHAGRRCERVTCVVPRKPLYAPPIPQKALTLSRKVEECKPLARGGAAGAAPGGVEQAARRPGAVVCRGLHSFAFQINPRPFLTQITP